MFTVAPMGVNRGRGAWSTLRRALPALHRALLPPRCLLCGAPGLQLAGYGGPVELCAACLGDWPGTAALPPPVAPVLSLLCCPWVYAWPVNQLVRALKFSGELSHARLFGVLLAAERSALGKPWPQLIVPVPLHPLRLQERGYNQAAELARHAGRACGLPVRVRALRRVRATREQSALGASARSANVAGAFRATAPLAGLRVALLDDVITTGSTAAAAAGALRAAGAIDVELWAVARAIHRRDARSA